MADPLAEYDCKQNEGTMALAVVSVLLSIAIVTVTVRLYIRIVLRRCLGWDDYTMIGSLVSGIVAFALYVKLIQSGMGRHLVCLTFQNIEDVARWSLFAQIFIAISLGLTKVSVCLFIIRLIDKARRNFTICLWVVIVFVILSHTLQVILFLVQCRPIDAAWNLLLSADCFSTQVVYTSAYVNYSLDCFADFLCVGVAIYVISRLQMNTQTKIALCCLIGLGLFTAACVIADAVTLGGVFDVDTTWAITAPALWAGVGAFVGITIASIPILKPLFSKVFEIATMHTGSSRSTFRKIRGRRGGKGSGSGGISGSTCSRCGHHNGGNGGGSGGGKGSKSGWDSSGGNVSMQQRPPPAAIRKTVDIRQDLESFGTGTTLTQNTGGSRSEPEIWETVRIPPGAYWQSKGAVRYS